MSKEIVQTITTTIEYRWWIPDNESNDEILEDHVEILKDAAEDRIEEMVKEGYSSGQLLYGFTVDGSIDGSIDYQGWWEYDKKYKQTP